MKTHVTTIRLHKASKTTQSKRLVKYTSVATLAIVVMFISLYCYAVGAVNSALAGFYPWR